MHLYHAGQTAGFQHSSLSHKRSTEVRFGLSPILDSPEMAAYATGVAEMVEDGFYNRKDQRDHGTIILQNLMKLAGPKVRGIDDCLSRAVAAILVHRGLIGRIPRQYGRISQRDDVFTFGDPEKALAELGLKPE